MENEPRNRTALIAVVTGVVMLLLGLCAGAVVGGFAGYALGERNASRVLEQPSLGNPSPFTGPGLRSTPIIPRPGATGGASAGQGVTVLDVVTGSPADNAGIQPGDVITTIDNVPIDANHRLPDVLGQYKPGDTVRVTLLRGGSSRALSVKLGSASGNSQTPYLGVRYNQPNAPAATPNP